jgi:mersacidin/lichenicidin family type 2 lantibiotic
MAELNALDIVRAWKDDEYRSSLPADVQSQIPEAPDGIDQVTVEQLEAATGGTTPACIGAAAGVVGAAAAVAGTIRHWND